MSNYFFRPELRDLTKGARLEFIREFRYLDEKNVAEELGLGGKDLARTIRDYETLSREVREAKDNGYALDRGEHTEASSCLAVPVYDFTHKMIAAISVSGYGLLENHSIETIFKEMKNASQEISRRMGFPFSDTFTQMGGNI